MEKNFTGLKVVFTSFTLLCVALFTTSVHAQVYDFDFTNYKVNVTETSPTSTANLEALFDKNLDTDYEVPSDGQTVTIELEYPILLSGYAVKTTATSCIVEYSADGSAWEPVGVSETIDKEGYLCDKDEFEFENSYSEKYYRLIVSSGNVSEWQLFGVPVVSSEYDFPEDLIATVGGKAQFMWSTETVKGTSPDNIFNRLYGNGDEYRASFNTNKEPLEIIYTFNSAQTVKRYSISTYNTGALANSRSPQTWTLYGSDNGISWTELDFRSDFQFPLIETAEGKSKCTTMEFEVAEPASYTMYKLEIQCLHAYLDLLEVQLFGTKLSSAISENRLDQKEITIRQNGDVVTIISGIDNVVYSIYNISGQVVKNGHLMAGIEQNISLPEGIYVIKSEDSVKKFIIEK